MRHWEKSTFKAKAPHGELHVFLSMCKVQVLFLKIYQISLDSKSSQPSLKTGFNKMTRTWQARKRCLTRTNKFFFALSIEQNFDVIFSHKVFILYQMFSSILLLIFSLFAVLYANVLGTNQKEVLCKKLRIPCKFWHLSPWT